MFRKIPTPAEAEGLADGDGGFPFGGVRVPVAGAVFVDDGKVERAAGGGAVVQGAVVFTLTAAGLGDRLADDGAVRVAADGEEAVLLLGGSERLDYPNSELLGVAA